MAALPANLHTVIFSNEHCHSRLTSTEHIGKLHALLEQYFETVTVVAYLCRQDIMAGSLYSTYRRFGGAIRNIFPAVPDFGQSGESSIDPAVANYGDFDLLLRRYVAVFCKQFVRPQIYDEELFLSSNIISDFLVICGLPARLSEGSERQNRAVTDDGRKLLAMLNAYLVNASLELDYQRSAEIQNICLSILETNLVVEPRVPSRSAAQRFYANFRNSNERIRELWFPYRTSLFSADFNKYPDFVDAEKISSHERALNAAFTCIVGLMNQRKTDQAQEEMAVEAIKNSTSWKITAPIRTASLLLKHLSRRRLVR